MTKTIRLVAILLALLTPLMGTAAAHAEGRVWPTSGELLRQGIRACGGDIAQFCGRTVPGQGRIMQCLTDAYNDLSGACQSFVDRTFDLRNVGLSCAADAERLCPGVLPGGGRIAACLYGQQDRLSDACFDAVGSVLEDRGK